MIRVSIFICDVFVLFCAMIIPPCTPTCTDRVDDPDRMFLLFLSYWLFLPPYSKTNSKPYSKTKTKSWSKTSAEWYRWIFLLCTWDNKGPARYIACDASNSRSRIRVCTQFGVVFPSDPCKWDIPPMPMQFLPLPCWLRDSILPLHPHYQLQPHPRSQTGRKRRRLWG